MAHMQPDCKEILSLRPSWMQICYRRQNLGEDPNFLDQEFPVKEGSYKSPGPSSGTKGLKPTSTWALGPSTDVQHPSMCVTCVSLTSVWLRLEPSNLNYKATLYEFTDPFVLVYSLPTVYTVCMALWCVTFKGNRHVFGTVYRISQR